MRRFSHRSLSDYQQKQALSSVGERRVFSACACAVRAASWSRISHQTSRGAEKPAQGREGRGSLGQDHARERRPKVGPMALVRPRLLLLALEHTKRGT